MLRKFRHFSNLTENDRQILFVMPVKTGIQSLWIPAFAGMTWRIRQNATVSKFIAKLLLVVLCMNFVGSPALEAQSQSGSDAWNRYNSNWQKESDKNLKQLILGLDAVGTFLTGGLMLGIGIAVLGFFPPAGIAMILGSFVLMGTGIFIHQTHSQTTPEASAPQKIIRNSGLDY